MSTRQEDMQFYEWLFGRRSSPIIKDSITVPHPFNYKPIEVGYQPSEHRIKVNTRPNKFTLKDFWNGREYVDEDGQPISKAEAQAEVDWLNWQEIGE